MVQIINKYSILIVLCFCLIQSCNIDQTKNLGSGYTYRDEGGQLKEIYHEYPKKGGQIPSTVVSYDFDRNFIIVKQKPKLPQDPLYEKDFVYNKGKGSYYFWVVLKKDQIVIGPLDSAEFAKLRVKYNITRKLRLL